MKATIKQKRALRRGLAKSMVMIPLYKAKTEQDKTKYSRKGKAKWKL